LEREGKFDARILEVQVSLKSSDFE